MHLIRKLYTTLGSISKKRLYDLGYLNKSRFKAHTIVEDKTWILVRGVLVANDHFSNAIISDINGNLLSFQLWIKCSQNSYILYL